jgi:hypothetical protein
MELREFLSELATNPTKLGEFIHDPETAMTAAKLSDEDQAALRSGFPGVIYARLAGMPTEKAFGMTLRAPAAAQQFVLPPVTPHFVTPQMAPQFVAPPPMHWVIPPPQMVWERAFPPLMNVVPPMHVLPPMHVFPPLMNVVAPMQVLPPIHVFPPLMNVVPPMQVMPPMHVFPPPMYPFWWRGW